ncbi:hypothetical protein [Chitinimonas koreensis]|uniref:hypothetical protein n=1 Tax=Chitinimonas koreensis TaxID=356302 RepID=UPI0012FAEBA4|nr:hypothetical protein [Chitinimonas koreensis]QNM98685.1 hypothetical protein H9L41_10945 [Chitinimonas koreensis]
MVDNTLAYALLPTADAPDQCQGYLLITKSEYQQTILAGFFNSFSASDGALVSIAIVSCWAVAFGMKQLRNLFRSE